MVEEEPISDAKSFDDFRKFINEAFISGGYYLVYMGHGKSEEEITCFDIFSDLEDGNVSMEFSMELE